MTSSVAATTVTTILQYVGRHTEKKKNNNNNNDHMRTTTTTMAVIALPMGEKNIKIHADLGRVFANELSTQNVRQKIKIPVRQVLIHIHVSRVEMTTYQTGLFSFPPHSFDRTTMCSRHALNKHSDTSTGKNKPNTRRAGLLRDSRSESKQQSPA